MKLNTGTKQFVKTPKQMTAKITSLQKKKMELEAKLAVMNQKHLSI